MKSEKAIAIGVLLMLTLVFLASTCAASIIYVPDKYSTIQEAVNAASPRDTIIVRDGTYTENIKVDKRLTIRSENGADSTIIQANDPDEHVFNVTADYVEISGFTVEGAYKGIGIYLYHADYCNILNNSCLKNYYGILFYYSNNTQITENTFINNSYGLYLASSSNNLIYHNNIINIYRSKSKHHGIRLFC
jgi:parallel beta-helix repeat protein